jgi:photosystem II stability/assembly factor-like uncharacterized protein
MRNLILLLIGIIICFFSQSQSILIDETKWFRKGPNCAYVISLAMAPSNPDVIYIGTYSDGVYKTIDGGETWIYCSTEILPQYEDSLSNSPTLPCWYFGHYYPIYDIAIHPQDENHLWIGTQERGLFESTNGGSSWQKANETLPDTLAVNLIQINHQNSNDILLGTGGYFTPGSPQNGGIYRTLDAGNIWNLAENLPHGNTYNITDIKRDPTINDHILVGISSAGVSGFSWGLKESYDDGNTWQELTANILDFGNIWINPTNNQNLWGVGLTGFGEIYLFYSNDGGHNWNLFEGFEDPYKWVTSLYCDADFNLYIERETDEPGYDFSILKSPDNGTSWFGVDKLSNKISYLSGTIRLTNRCQAEASNTNNVYFGTYYGVFHSEDGGVTTQIQNANLLNSYILDIEVNPKNNDIIYATGNQGLWKSIDGGLNWGNILHDHLNVVKSDLKHPDTIYFGGRGLWRSFDGGQTCQKIVDGFGEVSDISINPKETNVLYYKHNSSIYRSIDWGNSWEFIFNESLNSVYREIVMDPNHPDTIYLGRFRTTDGGDSWENAFEKLIMAVHPQDANIIYATNLAGYGNSSVEVSYDWGNSFQTLAEYQNGPFPNYNIYCFRIDEKNPDYMFYSTRNTKIFYSSDAGSNWLQLEGIYNRRVTDIIPFVDENKYFLSTHGDGVWIYDTTFITEVDKNLLLTENNLLTISPNPFKNQTKLTFNILKSGIVNISIYSLHGGVIRTLINENKITGEYEIIWDGKDNGKNDIPKGIYIVSFQSDNRSSSRKIYKLK